MDDDKINAFVLLMQELDPYNPDETQTDFLYEFEATLTTDERYEAYVRLDVINEAFFAAHPKLQDRSKTEILNYLDTLADAMSDELEHLDQTMTEIAMGTKTIQDVLEDAGKRVEAPEEKANIKPPKPPTYH
ncbi:MAG: hypothetical protein H6867_04360 [Rhodospirillales bacterium]|nr:hypothetical protein [Rhodospirillales bacterium]MCB9996383.1 hypothetical protein [Rhodospirillales bacterium]